MNAQALHAQAPQAMHPTRWPCSNSRPDQVATRRVLAGAVLLVVSLFAWGMLKAEFQETFHHYSADQAATPEQSTTNSGTNAQTAPESHG